MKRYRGVLIFLAVALLALSLPFMEALLTQIISLSP